MALRSTSPILMLNKIFSTSRRVKREFVLDYHQSGWVTEIYKINKLEFPSERKSLTWDLYSEFKLNTQAINFGKWGERFNF